MRVTRNCIMRFPLRLPFPQQSLQNPRGLIEAFAANVLCPALIERWRTQSSLALFPETSGQPVLTDAGPAFKLLRKPRLGLA
jgi:hypothetical protein